MHVAWDTDWTEDDARSYDAFVQASPAGHPAQTRAWANVARAAAHVAAHFAVVRDGGEVVGTAFVQRPTFGPLALPWASVDRGPVVANVSALGGVARAVARALARRGVGRVRMMPYWADEDALQAELALRSVGMRDVQQPDGPHACTIRVDLGGKRAGDLFAGKSLEQIRWRSGQARRAGAVARRGEDGDWPRLREMYRALMQMQGKHDKRDRWWRAVRDFVADESRGALFACDYGGRTVAACVVLRHGVRATYTWGASVAEKLPFSKAIPALVAAIGWAHDVGCTSFDLGGVPVEGDTDRKRSAIAMFKYDFGRRRVRLVHEHAGCCWR
jgi:lipid II:glycine glycyltransferase (peptidoglycan interpeptide bridge formation enzyme)